MAISEMYKDVRTALRTLRADSELGVAGILTGFSKENIGVH